MLALNFTIFKFNTKQAYFLKVKRQDAQNRAATVSAGYTTTPKLNQFEHVDDNDMKNVKFAIQDGWHLADHLAFMKPFGDITRCSISKNELEVTFANIESANHCRLGFPKVLS